MLKKMIIAILIVLGIWLSFVSYNSSKEANSIDKKEEEKKEKEDKESNDFLFKKYYTSAEKILKKMTIEEKIAQLFLVRYDKSLITKYSKVQPGGYVLFAKDFDNHTKDEMINEIKNDQKSSKYPLIMAVDEEGGFVTRVSRFKAYREEKFKSPREYFEEGGYDLLEETEKEKITLLKELGINLNLAPVADVSENEEDFINNRTFGKDAKTTSDLIKHMVQYANKYEFNSCLKHFPGYGNNEDTHTGIAIDERDYDNFVNNDYLPFIEGIKEGVPAILISHNVIKAIDDSYPASLSEKVIKELREKLNFTGIIITDDLAMAAVDSYVSNNEAATLAVNSGDDMIITSDFDSMYQEVLNSYNEEKIKEETINIAVKRIIAWKYKTGLFE